MPRLTRSVSRKANRDTSLYLENLKIKLGGQDYTRKDFEEETDDESIMTTVTLRPMNIWSKQGLDLSDSTFVKLYDSATKFSEKDDNGDALKKFKLSEPERFNELRNLLTAKVNKLAMKKLLKVTQGGEDFNLLDQAQLVTEGTMDGSRDAVWGASADPKTTHTQEAVDKISDVRIKSHAIGLWLEDALSSDALAKLEHCRPKYTIEKDGEPFIHGQFLWWLIVDEVKPNNDTLIQHAKDKLNSLDASKFDHSVKEMLTEFDNIAFDIVSKLKGNLSEDEKITALWKCLATMKEEKFSNIVFEEKRKYRNSTASVKTSCDEFIRLFKREQVNMEADKIWNKPSSKDQQIIALTSMLRSVVNNVNTSVANNSTNQSGGNSGGNPFSKTKSKKGQGTPPWKFENPDKKAECDRDGKHWWWCPKHYNPHEGVDGMWVRHKPEDHKNEFKPSRQASDGKENAKPSGDDNRSYAEAASNPAVTVDDNMFQALKSGADIQVFLNRISANTNTTDLN